MDVELIQFDFDGLPLMFGFPIILTEATGPIGAKGDIVLADLSQYIMTERGSKVLAASTSVL